jgi:hypothetical protein
MPSDEELRQVGRIAIAAGSLDLYVSELLFALINPKRIGIGAHLVAGDTTSLQLKRIADIAVYALLGDRNEHRDLIADVEAWSKRAQKSLEERNRVIHGGYFRGDPSGLGRLAYRRGGALHPQSHTIEQLADMADKIEGLIDEAEELWRRVALVLDPRYQPPEGCDPNCDPIDMPFGRKPPLTCVVPTGFEPVSPP